MYRVGKVVQRVVGESGSTQTRRGKNNEGAGGQENERGGGGRGNKSKILWSFSFQGDDTGQGREARDPTSYVHWRTRGSQRHRLLHDEIVGVSYTYF